MKRTLAALAFTSFGIFPLGSAVAADAVRPCDLMPSSANRIASLRVASAQTAVPAVGEVATTDIGSSMIAVTQTDVVLKRITVTRDLPFQVKSLGQSFDTVLPKGVYEANSWDGALASFEVKAVEYRSARTGRQVARFALPILHIRYDPATGALAGMEKAGSLLTAEPTPISRMPEDVIEERCTMPGKVRFRRELLYSGVNQGSVHLIYREFSDDLIRPAFTQDLNYDLAEGAEIGFRGARFRIEEATNTSITFRVISALQ